MALAVEWLLRMGLSGNRLTIQHHEEGGIKKTILAPQSTPAQSASIKQISTSSIQRLDHRDPDICTTSSRHQYAEFPKSVLSANLRQ